MPWQAISPGSGSRSRQHSRTNPETQKGSSIRKPFNKLTLAVLAALGLGLIGFAPVAKADWNPGDPYKMHYAQLPDSNGWDVLFTQPKILADDWRCTETGPVSDVHFWFSAERDYPFAISNVHLSIHADIPASPTNHSMPGALL